MTTTATLYGAVVGHAERIAIVASGPSLKGVPLTFGPSVTVITVNAAIEHVPQSHAWFTLDPSPLNQRIMMQPRAGVQYYVAMPDRYAHRFAPHSTLTYLRRVEDSVAHGMKGCLSEDPGAIHCGNSGWGALGVAYHMRPQCVALFGIDGRGGYAWGPGKPRRLDHLGRLFATAVPQLKARGIEVVVGSPASIVECWPRMTPQHAMEWIND